MTIGRVESLDIVHVADHGIPNHEHIAIYVEHHCELSEYCLFIGFTGLDGLTVPIRDHMLWFGHGTVNRGDWIIVYTASGSTTITNAPPNLNAPPGARVIAIHWGKDHTIFQNRSLVPMIIQIGAVGTEEPPEPQFQGRVKKEQHKLV